MTERVLAGILVGGASSRMGTPKAALPWGDGSLLEAVVAALGPVAREVVLLGTLPGDGVPTDRALRRIPDAAGIEGPLAGIAAALRAEPEAAWIVAGCDQPWLDAAALAWLLEQRGPGVSAVLPLGADGRVEPLPALYEPSARRLLANAAGRGPSSLAGAPGVATPRIPPALLRAWRSVNTREEYERLRDSP